MLFSLVEWTGTGGCCGLGLGGGLRLPDETVKQEREG